MLVEVKPRTRKPAFGSVEVDRAHPLARDVFAVFLLDAGPPVNLVRPTSVVVHGAPKPTTTKWGRAQQFNGSTDYYVLSNLRSTFTGFSVAARLTAIASSYPMLAVYNDGQLELRLNSSTGSISFVDSAGGIAATDSVEVPRGSFVGTQTGTAVTVYRDGNSVGTATGGNLSSATLSGSHAIGARTGGSFLAQMSLDYLYWFARALPQQDVQWIHAEPYAFLKDKLYPFFSFPWGKVAAAGPITVTVNQVSETDLAQPIGRLKTSTLGQATETDLAQPITVLKGAKLIPVNQVTETDVAQPITRLKSKTLGQPAETDLAQPITRLKRLTLGQPSEIDIAQPLSRIKQRILAQAIETEIAQAIGKAKRQAIGQAHEVDLAQPITRTGGSSGGGPGGGGPSYGILRVIRG